MKEYLKNSNKWKAAEDYAKQRGYNFTVLTERDLF
jgi:outer membrane translocation and assembly module TamA